jgi:hypothetical protein
MNRRQSLIGIGALSLVLSQAPLQQAYSQDFGEVAKRLLEAASPLGDRSLG